LRGTLAAALLSWGLLLPHPSPAAGRRLLATVDFGFDSFTERYSVVEEDTVENVAEFRSRLDLAYQLGRQGGDYFLLGGTSALGTSSDEYAGRLALGHRGRSTRLSFEGRLALKRFRENSSYSYGNDYRRLETVFYASRRVGSSDQILLTHYLEGMDFRARTEFDYDYLRSTTVLGWERSTGGLFYARAGLQATSKSIPDSTEIAYKAYGASLEVRKEIDGSRGFEGTVLVERRLYAHKPTRSPFWSLEGRFALRPLRWGAYGLKWETTAELYDYDWDSDVYFSYLETRTALLVTYRPGLLTDLAAGPSFAFLESSYSSMDRYREAGARVEAESSRISSLWVSLAAEVGWRNYEAYSADTEGALFSDFLYYRLDLFLAWKIGRGFSLDGFFDHQPEKHKRAGDDNTTTLFSVDLSYSF